MRHFNLSKLYRAATALFACLILACAAAVAAIFVAPKTDTASAETRAASYTYVESDFDIQDNIKVAGVGRDSDGVQYDKVLVGIKQEALNSHKGAASTAVNIPEGVTAIAERAFKNSTSNGGNAAYANITSVTIPKSVQYIGPEAFYGLSNLTEINFTDGGSASLEIAGTDNYSGGVNISAYTTNVSGAFAECSSVPILKIPDRTTKIGKSAFYNFRQLKEYTAPFAGGKSSATPDQSTLLNYVFGGSGSGMTGVSSTYYTNDSSTSTSWASNSVPTTLKKVTITGGANNGANAASGVMSGAFYNFTMLEEVVLPQNITTIHAATFYGCRALQKFTLPSSVTTIAQLAFYDCDALTEIDLTNVATLGDSNYGSIFKGCDNLHDVKKLSNSLTSIPKMCFYECRGISSITLPDGVINIHDQAFYKTGLTSISIPSSVQTMGIEVFRDCTSLQSITLPTSGSMETLADFTFYGTTGLTKVEFGTVIQNIGKSAFQNSHIENITLPTQLKTIGESAFNGTYLTHIEIPANVTSIGNSAFSSCRRLGSAELDENLQTIGNYAFYYCDSGSFTSVKIPSKVKSIGDNAFASCTYLTNVTLESEVLESVGNSAFASTRISSIDLPASVTSLGSGVFSGCSNLTHAYLSKIKLSDPNKELKDSMFSSCSNLTVLSLPDDIQKIGANAFSGCRSLTDIKIPTSVTSIGASAFSGCTGIAGLQLPSGLQTIGNSAFANCSNLRNITIPSSVTSFSEGTTPTGVFSGCSALETVTFECDYTQAIASSMFYRDRALTTVLFKGEYAPTSIGSSAFYETKIQSFTIPESVTSIGNSAFYGCTEMKLSSNVQGKYLPTNLTTLGSQAFYNCSGINEVNIPAQITATESSVFYGCSNLQTVTFDDITQFKSFGTATFQNCAELRSITLPENLENLSANDVFNGCKKLSSVTYGSQPAEDGVLRLPSTIKSLGTNNFKQCEQITKVYWISNLTAIPDGTFSGCISLAEVIFPEDMVLTKVGSNAFYNCKNYITFDFDKYADIEIGDYAFFGCKFSSLDLSHVKSIGEGAIGGNSTLQKLTVAFIGKSATTTAGRESTLGYIFGRTRPDDYSTNTFTQITQHYQQSETNTGVSTSYASYYIPTLLQTVNLIGYNIVADGSGVLPAGSFENFRNLREINLPEISEIRDYAFYYCSAINEIVIPSSVETFKSSQTNVAHIFEGCNNLQSLTIPFIGVSNIKNRNDLAVMFGVTNENDGLGVYTGLNKVELTNTDTLGNNAFRNARNLKTIILPENMTSIADGALSGCIALEELTLPFLGLNEASSETATLSTVFGGNVPANLTKLVLRGGRLGAGAFEGSSLRSVTLPDNLSEIPARAFKDCGSLVEIVFGESGKITSVGDYAFSGCGALSSLALSSSVTNIGAHAFENCALLSDFTIPANAQKIGDYAFAGCNALQNIELRNVTDLGERAFENCRGLKSVALSSMLTKISDGVFAGCSQLKKVSVYGAESNEIDITLPSAVVSIGNYAFDRCGSVETVSLSENLKTIGRFAFTDNSALRILIIPAGVTAISYNAFQNCGALEFVYLPDNASYGTNAFSNLPQSATLIASGKGAYDKIIKQNTLLKEQITYIVPITYHQIMGDGTDNSQNTEQRLYKKTFAYTRNSDGSWSEKANLAVNRPMEGYESTVWRTSNKTNATIATVDSVNAILNEGAAQIDLYAKFYKTSDFKPSPKVGIVYGDVPIFTLAGARAADTVNYINSNFLVIEGDQSAILKSDILRVVGWRYTPVSGGSTTEPAELGNAGTYEISLNLVASLGEWHDNITLEVTIERSVVYADIDWAYSKPDGAGGTEINYLLDFNGTIDDANKSFKNSAVQGDGTTIVVDPYTVLMDEIPTTPSGRNVYNGTYPDTNENPNSGKKSGGHHTMITLTLTEKNNYEFRAQEEGTLTLRNLTISYGDGAVTITKVWYVLPWAGMVDDEQHEAGSVGGTIAAEPPKILDEDGEEWTMPLRWEFGSAPNVSRPIVKNNEGEVLANPQITFTILSNSGAPAAARATSQIAEFIYLDFEQWINRAVPAGEYTLALHADQNVWGSAIDKSYRFTVKARSFDTSELFKENGGVYEFAYDGSVKLPEVNLTVPEVEDLRSGTGWASEDYNDYYSSGYNITYSVNHSRFMPVDEIAEELGGMLVNVLRDDDGNIISYDVYYRITADNYTSVGGTTATYKFTVKLVPGENSFTTEYDRPDWAEGEAPSTARAPVTKFSDGDFSYTIKYFTDPECTKEYTDSEFKIGKYYVKVYVPASANWNELESNPYEFEVLAHKAIADPTIHRQAGLGSPNGFSLTTPATVNMRLLTIVLIVIGIVILLAILVLIFIIAWRAHRRRRELYERIMNITSKPLSAYLPPQMNAALAYAPAEPATALPYTAGEVAAADDENPDPDGFYEKFVSQADIDAVFGKMKTPIGSYGASAFQQTESVDGAEQTVDSAEETEENIEAQAPDNGTTEGGDGNEE